MVIPQQFVPTGRMEPQYPTLTEDELALYRSQINCNFEQLDAVFEDCMMEAKVLLSEQGIKDYLDGASLVTMIGRGFDPILTYLEDMPQIS